MALIALSRPITRLVFKITKIAIALKNKLIKLVFYFELQLFGY